MFAKILFDELEKNKDFNYAIKLPFFANNKELAFKKGLNIIFAPNGSGKSTILSMLANAMACEQGGFSTVTHSWAYYSKSLEGINVVHDGQSAMYSNPREAVGLIGGAFDDDFMDEGIFNAMNKQSTGKTTLLRLSKILPILTGQVKMVDDIDYRTKKEWIKGNRCDVLLPQIEKGQKTIILDEPESGLAIHVQNNLFKKIDEAAKEQDLQIIVATHSIFSLACSNANFIELEEGYIDITKSQVLSMFSALIS